MPKTRHTHTHTHTHTPLALGTFNENPCAKTVYLRIYYRLTTNPRAVTNIVREQEARSRTKSASKLLYRAIESPIESSSHEQQELTEMLLFANKLLTNRLSRLPNSVQGRPGTKLNAFSAC